MKTKWADLVRDLMREHAVSERRLCIVTGVNRSSFRRFLQGESHLTIDRLDKLLELFGYELDFMKVGTATEDILAPPELPLTGNRPIIRTISIRRKAA